MGLSLRGIRRKITDVFDANTASDQKKRLAAGQPRMYQQQQAQNKVIRNNQEAFDRTARVTAYQKYGVRAPKPQSIGGAFRDVLDANTAQDKYKRNLDQVKQALATPTDKPEYKPKFNQLYTQEQKDRGVARPYDNIGQQVLGSTARLVNTSAAGDRAFKSLPGLAKESLFGTDASYKKKLNSTSERLDKDLSPTSGVLRAGTIFNDSKEAGNISFGELSKKAGASGLGVYGELSPVQAGEAYKGANLALKVATRTGIGASEAALGNVGEQYILTGKVDPKQVATATAFGAGLSNVSPMVGDVAKKGINSTPAVVKKGAQAARKADKQLFNQVGSNPAVRQLDDTITQLNAQRGNLVAKGLSENSPAVRANALSVQQALAEKQRVMSKVSQRGGSDALDELLSGKPKATLKNSDLPKSSPLYIDPNTEAGLKLPDPTKYTAQPLPITKPNVKAKGVPAGTGTIPLEQLGKAKNIVEGEPRNIVGKVKKDEVVQDVLSSVSKQRGKSSVEGSLVAGSISRKAKELGVKLDRSFIDKYQTGALNTPAERQLADHIKQETDRLFLKQQALDPTIEYRKNYVPQSYDNTAAEVTAAVNKLEKSTGAARRRAFSTYAEAEQFGLKPKNIGIDQMIGESAAKAEKVAQNADIVKKGLTGGVFTTEQKGVPLAGVIAPNGSQVYATKEVADIVNGVLQKDSQGLPAAIGKVARAFETSQDIMLQGGIPGTNANFFVAGQAIKDTTRNIGKAPLHPIEAAKQEGHLLGDLFRGKSSTQKRFTQGTFNANGQVVKNTDFVRAMADRGLYIQPQTGMSDLGGSGVRTAWNTLGNKPTFGRYMPNRMLSTAQEVYSQSVKKLGHEQALQLAADTTKTFNGHVDTILKGRTNLDNDMRGVLLFAPKYRESIINALGNVAKSVYPTKWADKSYAPSRQLLAGMAVTLGAYEMINRQTTGHSMMENRQGQELSVEVPYGEKDAKGNQKVVNIPFMPGFMTIPRMLVGAASAVKNADVKGVIAEGSKALSSPLQTAGRVLANQDYFGRPIYNDENTAAQEGVAPDSLPTATKKIAGYVLGQNSPSWVRAVMDKASGKPTEQAIATALEAPVRFGKHLNPETTAYFKDRDAVYNSLDKNSRSVWDSIHPRVKNVNGEYMVDKTVDSGLARASNYLNNPDVLQAENEMARRAKARGQKVDPLFGDLTPQQQRIALRMDTLPPKDPNKTVLRKENPWYQDYTNKRSRFFDSLPAGDPNKPKGPITYPEPSARVSSIQNAYYQLKDSGMKRDFMKNNPELAEQFAKEEQYTRAVRAMKDLPQYDKYPEAPKDVQNLMDFYLSLPSKESGGKSKVRSAWIKSHPAEWGKMTDQFSRQAQYNLQQDAQIAAFEGQDLTEKGIKSIASLAKSLGMSSGGGGYGGGGGGKSKGPGSAEKYAISVDAGGKAKLSSSTSVKYSGKAKVAARSGGSKPKVTLKKSKV